MGALEGSYFSNHYAADNPDPGQRRFVTVYREAYGTEPDTLAALGYDAARLAVDAMQRAPELSGPALREALVGTTVLPSVTGPLSFDEKRNAVKPAVIMRFQGDGFRYVTTVTP
ncbi:ABC transporter substrate-binding protein [Archangium gephyra]|uniref:ABC transporter substrate-binding protein n=1 Tax=Archangium gephyra TaxID=48 RepID=UPI0035D43C46